MAGNAHKPKLDAALLAKAQAAVDALKVGYREHLLAAGQRLIELRTAYDAGNDRLETARDLYAAGHDLKGQAATFGYELVTEVADLLCEVLHPGEMVEVAEAELVDKHISALLNLIDQDFQGTGGETGEAVLHHLQSLRA